MQNFSVTSSNVLRCDRSVKPEKSNVFKGTVMHIEKALINDLLRVSKVS